MFSEYSRQQSWNALCRLYNRNKPLTSWNTGNTKIVQCLWLMHIFEHVTQPNYFFPLVFYSMIKTKVMSLLTEIFQFNHLRIHKNRFKSDFESSTVTERYVRTWARACKSLRVCDSIIIISLFTEGDILSLCLSNIWSSNIKLNKMSNSLKYIQQLYTFYM